MIFVFNFCVFPCNVLQCLTNGDHFSGNLEMSVIFLKWLLAKCQGKTVYC